MLDYCFLLYIIVYSIMQASLKEFSRRLNEKKWEKCGGFTFVA